MTFDELPLELTSLLERESWMRASASALYVDRDALWTSDRRFLSNLAMALDGEAFRIVDGPFAGFLVDPATVHVASRSET